MNELIYVPYRHTQLRPVIETGDAYWIKPDGNVLYKENKSDPINPETTEVNFLESNRIVNIDEHMTAMNTINKLKQQGESNPDVSGTYGIKDEYYDKFALVQDTINSKGVKEARNLVQQGAIDGQSYSDIKTTLEAIGVTGMNYIQHVLLQLVKRQTSNRLDLKWLNFEAPTNQIWDDIGFLSMPDTAKGRYATQTEVMKTMGYKFDIMEDFFLYQYDDPQIIQRHQQAILAELDNALNLKIATAWNAISGSNPTANWVAFTGEHNTAIPQDDVSDQIDTMVLTQRLTPPFRLVSQKKPLKAYLRNTNINGELDKLPDAQIPSGINGIARNIKELETEIDLWGYDNYMTAKHVFGFAVNNHIFTDGPKKLVQATDVLTGTRQQLYRTWNKFVILTFSGALTPHFKITNVLP